MKKKGFTLIELLAVLVILAILALITIPIVLSIIKNARESSYARSVEAYGRAVETAVMEYQMNNEGEPPTVFSAYTIKTSKNNVNCGESFEFVNDSVKLTGCTVNGSTVTFKYENGKASKEETYTAYSVGDQITVAGEKYYAIENSDETQDYVTALKANPLKASEIEAAGGTGVYTYSDTNRTGGMEYGSSTDYATSAIKSVIDSWSAAKFSHSELKTINNYGSRLITYDELITKLKCTGESWIETCSRSSYNWIYSEHYWYYTMSPANNSSSMVWIVDIDGGMLVNGVDSVRGAVRPVINVYKSKIGNEE